MQSVDDYLQKPQEIVDREVRLPKDGLESSPSKFIMHWNCQLPTIEIVGLQLWGVGCCQLASSSCMSSLLTEAPVGRT